MVIQGHSHANGAIHTAGIIRITCGLDVLARHFQIASMLWLYNLPHSHMPHATTIYCRMFQKNLEKLCNICVVLMAAIADITRSTIIYLIYLHALLKDNICHA